MEREPAIIPECYIDTNLVNTLVGKFCNHQKGCPTVFKVMEERMKDSFAVGVIDKDKREPKAFEEFHLFCNSEDLFVYKHRARPHYIIQVAPAAEEFILKAAKKIGVNLNDFGLPNDLDSLKTYSKKVDAKENSIFSSLFSALKQSPNMYKLQSILEYLLNNKYSSKLEHIIEIINSEI